MPSALPRRAVLLGAAALPLAFNAVPTGPSRLTIRWWSTSKDSAPARFAAEELGRYLAAITGRTPRIQRVGRQGPKGIAGLLLGPAGGTPPHADAPSEAKAPDLGDAPLDSYAIRADGRAAALSAVGDRALLYAVYDLLQRLGVRFFAPGFGFYGGHAEHVPSSYELPRFEVVERPAWRLRRRYVEEGWSFTRKNLPLVIDWMAKQRLNVLVIPYDYNGLGVTSYDYFRQAVLPELARRGISVEVGGHGYESFLPPADFPQYYTSGSPVFDVHNDAAVSAYVDKVAAYLRAHPEIEIFDCWPPDVSDWPKETIARFGSIPNAEAHVVNALAAAVTGVRIEKIAYDVALAPPDPAYALSPGVIVDFAPISRKYYGPINTDAKFAALLNQWRAAFPGDLAMYEYYRRYRWRSLPVHPLEVIAKDVAYEATAGVRGMGMYCEPADWIPNELVQLVVAALSWNPGLDVPGYVTTYLGDRFGPAAGSLAAYYARTAKDPDIYSGLDGQKAALADYGAARDALAAAAGQATSPSARHVIERLTWNADLALADFAIGKALLDDPAAVPGLRTAYQELATRRMFDGVILPDLRVHQRWGHQAGFEILAATAARYREVM